MLTGKKTYLAALAAILSAVGGYLSGSLDLAAALQLAFTGILSAALRNGIG